MAVTLENWEPEKEYERLGLDEQKFSVLGVSLPHIIVPVRPGRDLALMIEVAALNFRTKLMGINPVEELDLRIKSRLRAARTLRP